MAEELKENETPEPAAAPQPQVHPDLAALAADSEVAGLVTTQGWEEKAQAVYGKLPKPLEAIKTQPGIALAAVLGVLPIEGALIAGAATRLAPPQELKVSGRIEMEGEVEVEGGDKGNRWDAVDTEGDADLEAMIGEVLPKRLAKKLLIIPKLYKMVALEKCGVRTYIAHRAQLQDDGTSNIELPDDVAGLVFKWWRKVIHRSDDFALPEEREKVLRRSETIVPEDLDEMLQIAGRFGTAKSDLRAIGEGASFDIASTRMSLTDISLQIPDVLRLSAETVATSNLEQYFGLMTGEFDEYIWPIMSSAGFQNLGGGVVVDPNKPRATIGEALRLAGYPMAEAAFNWGNEQARIWHYLITCPGEDEQWALSLGRRTRYVLRANADFNRRLHQLSQKGGAISGAVAADPKSGALSPNVAKLVVPANPGGIQVLGFRIRLAGEFNFSVSRS